VKRSARVFCALLGGMIVFGLAPVPSGAQDYPTRPVEIIVGPEPGSSTDLASRAVASVISEYLGKPAVVINKVGGSNLIAGDYVMRQAKPDGYTIWHSGITITAPELYVKFRPAPFTSKEVEPVAAFSAYITCFVVHGDSPWNSMKDLVEYARQHPGLKFGIPGVATMGEIMGKSLANVANIKLVSLPAKGEAESVTMLLGKNIDFDVVSLGPVMPHLDSKKLKVIGVVAPKRIPQCPDVPTVQEQGYNLGIGSFLFGAFVRKGTPVNIIQRLSDAYRKTCEHKTYISQMTKLGLPVHYEDHATFSKSYVRDIEAVRKMFVQLGYLPN